MLKRTPDTVSLGLADVQEGSAGHVSRKSQSLQVASLGVQQVPLLLST